MLNIFRIIANVNVYLVAIPLVASIKTVFYYAMKKNNGTPEDLQKRLLQIVNHYQVKLLLNSC